MRQKGFVLVAILGIVVIVVAGLIYWQFVNKKDVIKATFNCPEGKYIKAEFSKEKVKLTLSDNRKVELPQAISASGARYANSDESFVFWNKGNSAFIEENGKTTLTDCVDTSNN